MNDMSFKFEGTTITVVERPGDLPVFIAPESMTGRGWHWEAKAAIENSGIDSSIIQTALRRVPEHGATILARPFSG